jgi:hypothetical protein
VGVGLLAEFALKVVMVETLSTDVVQAISGPLILGFTAALIIVTIRWGRRTRERRATARGRGELRRRSGRLARAVDAAA